MALSNDVFYCGYSYTSFALIHCKLLQCILLMFCSLWHPVSSLAYRVRILFFMDPWKLADTSLRFPSRPLQFTRVSLESSCRHIWYPSFCNYHQRDGPLDHLDLIAKEACVKESHRANKVVLKRSGTPPSSSWQYSQAQCRSIRPKFSRPNFSREGPNCILSPLLPQNMVFSQTASRC